jgi:hypothetical protein
VGSFGCGQASPLAPATLPQPEHRLPYFVTLLRHLTPRCLWAALFSDRVAPVLLCR